MMQLLFYAIFRSPSIRQRVSGSPNFEVQQRISLCWLLTLISKQFFFREMQMQFGEKEGRKLIKQLKVLLLTKWNRMNVKVVVEASSASEKSLRIR
jgi:hypothetical protein